MINEIKDTECELKPCPFCGGEAVMYLMHTKGYFQGFYVTCRTHKCRMTLHTKAYDKKHEAADSWNNRA